MKIVISGIGEMGSHLARMLSGNGHDITVIDQDVKALDELHSLADLITIEGDTTTFAVLLPSSARVRIRILFTVVKHVSADEKNAESNNKITNTTICMATGSTEKSLLLSFEIYLYLVQYNVFSYNLQGVR